MHQRAVPLHAEVAVTTQPGPFHIAANDLVPQISLAVTYAKAAMTPLATWDLFPGHHDPFYAQSQGQKSIYLNTVVLQGFADRVVTDWAGPAAFIARRKMVMKASVYPGDVLIGSGRVISCREEQGRRRIELALQLCTQSGVVCDLETTLVLPPREGLNSDSSSGN
jgi:acyl dehydratase